VKGKTAPLQCPSGLCGRRLATAAQSSIFNIITPYILQTKGQTPAYLRKYFAENEGKHGHTFRGGVAFCDNEIVLNSSAVHELCLDESRAPGRRGGRDLRLARSARRPSPRYWRGSPVDDAFLPSCLLGLFEHGLFEHGLALGGRACCRRCSREQMASVLVLDSSWTRDRLGEVRAQRLCALALLEALLDGRRSLVWSTS